MNMQWAKKSPAALVGVSLAVGVVIFVVDLFTPLGVADGALYVAMVLIGFWAPWWWYMYLMAGLGSLLTVIGYFAPRCRARPLASGVVRGAAAKE